MPDASGPPRRGPLIDSGPGQNRSNRPGRKDSLGQIEGRLCAIEARLDRFRASSAPATTPPRTRTGALTPSGQSRTMAHLTLGQPARYLTTRGGPLDARGVRRREAFRRVVDVLDAHTAHLQSLDAKQDAIMGRLDAVVEQLGQLNENILRGFTSISGAAAGGSHRVPQGPRSSRARSSRSRGSTPNSSRQPGVSSCATRIRSCRCATPPRSS